MKRIILTSSIVALAAAGYFLFGLRDTNRHSAGSKNDSPPSVENAPSGVQTAESKPERRPVVIPYQEEVLPPPPSTPPAGWRPPSFSSHPSDRLVRHPVVAKCPGEPAVARANSGGEVHEVHPNQVGHFDRVPVARKARIPFVVGYPAGVEGQTVIAVAEDGGSMGAGSVVAKAILGKELTAMFAFEVADRDGIFRVSVRKGSDMKAMEFWAGPEPAFIGSITK